MAEWTLRMQIFAEQWLLLTPTGLESCDFMTVDDWRNVSRETESVRLATESRHRQAVGKKGGCKVVNISERNQ